MPYYQIIIVLVAGDGIENFLVKESKVTPKMLRKMEEQSGEFPAWCLNDECWDLHHRDGEERRKKDRALCDIEKIGFRWEGKRQRKPRRIIRSFNYVYFRD